MRNVDIQKKIVACVYVETTFRKAAVNITVNDWFDDAIILRGIALVGKILVPTVEKRSSQKNLTIRILAVFYKYNTVIDIIADTPTRYI